MVHRFQVVVAAGCFALLLALGGCSQPAEPESEPVRPVQLATVQRETLNRIVPADGILRALNQSPVTPKITAPVSRFLVNRGDHVKAGQLVAVLENRDLQAAVADAKGSYEQAQAAYRNISQATVPDEVTKAQADLQAAQKAMDAAKKLVDSRQQLLEEGAIARRLVDEASVGYAQAKSQFDTAQRHLQSVENVTRVEDVKTAEGQRDSAQGKYDAAQAQLDYSEIRSPIAGVVADRPLFPGEIATPGTPLMTIMDISSVIARVFVPQTQAGFIRVGQPAKIASADGSEASGKVTVISPALDPQGTTLEVWIQAANPGERLRPGSTVHAEITADPAKNVLVVPIAALLPSSEGGTAVFTVGPDMVAHEHTVQVGIRTPDKAQILETGGPIEGLDAGARVIVAGGLGLEDGAKVALQAAAEQNGSAKQ
ncbi:MAG TPA: efflux RND transporter periplasmic adaptor subunit [Bryobacteraceae bacterium]|nr:efflux RND transporter periplasmic adaptor subunit [Bryobacteraceae bacterium]